MTRHVGTLSPDDRFLFRNGSVQVIPGRVLGPKDGGTEVEIPRCRSGGHGLVRRRTERVVWSSRIVVEPV